MKNCVITGNNSIRLIADSLGTTEGFVRTAAQENPNMTDQELFNHVASTLNKIGLNTTTDKGQTVSSGNNFIDQVRNSIGTSALIQYGESDSALKVNSYNGDGLITINPDITIDNIDSLITGTEAEPVLKGIFGDFNSFGKLFTSNELLYSFLLRYADSVVRGRLHNIFDTQDAVTNPDSIEMQKKIARESYNKAVQDLSTREHIPSSALSSSASRFEQVHAGNTSRASSMVSAYFGGIPSRSQIMANTRITDNLEKILSFLGINMSLRSTNEGIYFLPERTDTILSNTNKMVAFTNIINQYLQSSEEGIAQIPSALQFKTGELTENEYRTISQNLTALARNMDMGNRNLRPSYTKAGLSLLNYKDNLTAMHSVLNLFENIYGLDVSDIREKLQNDVTKFENNVKGIKIYYLDNFSQFVEDIYRKFQKENNTKYKTKSPFKVNLTDPKIASSIEKAKVQNISNILDTLNSDKAVSWREDSLSSMLGDSIYLGNIFPSVIDTLRKKIRKGDNNFNSSLLTLLENLVLNDGSIKYTEIKTGKLEEGKYGEYDSETKTITLAENIPNIPEMGISFESILVHEIIHAATVNAPRQVKERIQEFLDAVNTQIRTNIEQDVKDSQSYKKSKNKEKYLQDAFNAFYNDFNYRNLNNPDEFIADFFRNKELAKILDDLDATGKVQIRKKGIFQMIKEFVMDIFKMRKRENSYSALDEAAQLVSDAITLGSQKTGQVVDTIENASTKLNRINKLNSTNILYNAGIASENIKSIPKILKAMTEAVGEKGKDVLKGEIGVFRGISPVIQYVYRELYEKNIVDHSDMEAINEKGIISKQYLDRVLNYMKEDNFNGLINYKPENLRTALSIRDRVIISDGQRVSARPVAKYNNNFYSIVAKRNGNFELNNLDKREKIEVSVDNGIVTKVSTGEVLENIYSPLFYSEKAPTRDTRMLYAYNNDMAEVNNKVRALTSVVSTLIDDLVEEKRITNPGITREDVLNNITFSDLQNMIYAKVKYYSDNADNDNIEAIGRFSEHVDAFIDRTIAHLQFTEGIKINSKNITEKVRKTREVINDDVVIDDLSETEPEGEDNLIGDSETQNIQYQMKADTKKVFDRTSVKVKRALYSLIDPYAEFDDVMGIRPGVDVNIVKDAVLEALNNIFDVNDVVPSLEYYAKTYPFLYDLIDMMESDPILLTQVYNSLALTQVDAASIVPENNNPFQLINHSNLKLHKTTEWAANLSDGVRLDSNLYLVDTIGRQDNDKLSERSKNIQDHITELRNKVSSLRGVTEQERENEFLPIIDSLYQILNSVGIESSKDKLKTYLYGELNNNNPLETVAGILRPITTVLKGISSDLDKHKNTKNYFNSSDIASRFIKRYYGEVYEQLKKLDFERGESYVSEGGKGYYLNRQPSYASKIINGFKTNTAWQDAKTKIDKRAKFLHDNYFKYIGTYARRKPVSINGRSTTFFSDLLHRLVNDPAFANSNSYVSFKSIRDEGRTEFRELNEDSQLLALMGGFFANKNADSAYYPLPTLSDSSELAYMKGIRYTGDNYINDIVSNLTQLAISEYQRILIIDKAKKNGTMPDVANLTKRGDSFVKFPFLNKIKDELLSAEPTEIVDKISTEFRSYLNDLSNDFVNSFITEVEGNEELNTPKNLLNLIDYNSNRDTVSDFRDRMKNYWYNQYNAYAEFTHILGTDPALYKNPTDFQKRFKQVYSHGVPLDVTAKIPEMVYDASTGNILSTGEYVQTGKQKRVSLVLSDYTVYSAVSNQMIRSMERAFTDPVKRAEVITKLGAYNSASATINGIEYSRDLSTGEFFKGEDNITSDEYFEALGENKEQRYYIDKSGETPIAYETQRMNITDGQTFLSLTEMRSMMSMYANWTEKNELDYQKYKVYKENGLPVEGALTEFYNSIKSFYFNTADLQVGDNILKNNIQFKHSEAPLIPNSIMTGSELLQAISNFLENPPKVMVDGIEYEVGAISFDSTQKVGSTNVIDINDLSPEKVGEVLNDAVTNGQYVVTDYNSYIIQQPTKNHITNNTKQLIGSQPRRILYSNIPDGTVFNIQGRELNKEQYIKLLNNIVNKKIKDSFERLQERFSDNKQLSQLLIDTVLSSDRYPKELKEAFKLDSYGEFQLPLFNPINAIMVERMVTSLVRQNLTKQYIRGGKVVNTSNVGYSENLKLQYEEKDGVLIPTFFEAYMPFPGTQEEWDMLHDENGRFMKENVDPKFMETMFYRIPTEAKYSMLPIKIKEFLPPSSGVSIILPNEITTLTGLDFDIDSMYGFIYDYIVTDEGNIEVLESSNSDNYLPDDLRIGSNIRVQERVGWSRYSDNNYEVSSEGDKRFSAFYAQLSDGRYIEDIYQLDIKGNGVAIPKPITDKQNPIRSNIKKTGKFNRTISREQSWEEYKNLWRQYLNENPELLQELIERSKGKTLTDKFATTEVSQARALSEILNDINIPLPVQDIKPTIYKTKDKGSVNNLFIDVTLSNLLNPSSIEERFKIGGFDELMGISYDIPLLKMGYTTTQIEKINQGPNPTKIKKDLVEGAERDMNDVRNDLFFRNQNIIGMSNVALFANNKSARNLMSSLKNIFVATKSRKGKNKLYYDVVNTFAGQGTNKISLNNMTYTSDDGESRKASDDISQDLSAAVDISKSPVHPNMGVNNINVNVYNFLRVVGKDPRTVMALVSNPYIDWESLKYDPSIEKTLNEFTKLIDHTTLYDIINLFYSGKGSNISDIKTVFENANKRLDVGVDISKIDFKNIGSYFNALGKSLKTFADIVEDFNRVTRADSSNHGPQLSIENMVIAENNYEKNINNSANTNRVEVSEDFNDNFVNNFYNYSFKEMLGVFNDKFNVGVIRRAYELLPNSENSAIIENAYLNYAYDTISFYDGTRIFADTLDAFPNYFLEKVKNDPKYANNWFLSNVKKGNNTLYIDSYNRPDADVVSAGWMELYNDPNHREDAYNLAVHAMFRQDSRKGLNNLLNYIPSVIQRDMGLFKGLVNNQDILYDYILSEAIQEAGSRDSLNNWDITKIIPSEKLDDTDYIFDFIDRVAQENKKPYRFYVINKVLYYYDPANSKITRVRELIETLPQPLVDRIVETSDPETIPEDNMDKNTNSVEEIKDADRKENIPFLADSPLDVSIFASEEFDELKNIEGLSDILKSFQEQMVALEDSDSVLEQGIPSTVVNYLDGMMDYSSYPEFEGRDPESVKKEIDDTNSCLLG